MQALVAGIGTLALLAGTWPRTTEAQAAWRPSDGAILVLLEGGSRLREFDPTLDAVRAGAAPAGRRFVAARGFGRDWLLLDAQGGRTLAAAEGDGFRFQDHPRRAWDLEPAAFFDPGPPPPGGRPLDWDAVRGRPLLGAAAWESAPRIQWGPGWARIQVRSSRALEAGLAWRLAGGAWRRAPFLPASDDALRQRAWIEPLEPGARLELRLPGWLPGAAPEGAVPARLTAPAVAPGGPRPEQSV